MALLLLSLALGCGLAACPDPEPPLASAAALAPLPPIPGCPAPPTPRSPWVFPFNASETFTQPTQPTLLDAALALSAASRAACPHLEPSLQPWTLPTSGDVTLPPGAAILLSACALTNGSLTLGTLTIPAGSRLVLADSPLTLTAASIIVRGSLAAGSPTCRLRSPITITLTGSRPAPLQAASSTSSPYPKGIVVEGTGALDLHALQYAPTWTRLAAPAAPGDAWVFLQSPTNWEPGQTVIVTTTALKDARDYSETEEVSILHALTLPNGMGALHIAPPLRHSHYAGPEYQAEVGLLSRRLTIQGSAADSPATDAQPALCPPSPAAAPYFSALPCPNASLTGYGGHVMVAGQGGAAGRLSGVLLLRMGQTNYLARYPFHLHMLNGTGAASYLQDSAVWRSYYRCASIHGTYGAVLHANVAHDVVGHCYYLEDGVEEGNTLSYNLGSLVHPLFGGADNYFPTSGPGQSQEFAGNLGVSPTLTLPADATASVFYITNAYNRFIGNSASGGWSGYAFPSLATPINEHRAVPMSPLARPTLEFRGNTAHSSGYWWMAGGCLYVGGSLSYGSPSAPSPTLIYNPGRSSSVNPSGVSVAHALTVFNDTKLFLCGGVGLQHWGAAPAIYGLETHDVVKAANFFGLAVATDWLVTCRTANRPTYASVAKPGYQETSFLSSSSLFQSYDTGQSHIIARMTFRNCTPPPPPSRQTFQLLQMLTHSDQFTPDTMIVTSGLRFEGAGSAASKLRLGVTVNASFPTVSHRMQNWGDADGSLSGRGRPTLLGSSRQGWWWRLDANCTDRADWTMWACDDTPTRSSGSVSLMFDAAQQTAAPTGTLGSAACSNGGYATIPCPTIGRIWHLGYSPDTAMDLPLNAKISGPIGGFGWVVGGSAWRAPVVLNLTSPQVRADAALLLVLPYPPGSTFQVTALSTGSYSNAQRGLTPTPSWCTVTGARGVAVASNLCTVRFRAVDSIAAVRGGAGDTYHFDSATGHLYLRPTVQSQSYSFLGLPNVTASGGAGLGRVWGVQQVKGWAAQGLELPPRGGNAITIVSDCAGGVSADGAYCSLAGGNGGALPASPCPPGTALPLSAFDSCDSSSAGGGSGGSGGSGGKAGSEAQASSTSQLTSRGSIVGFAVSGALLALGAAWVAWRMWRSSRSSSSSSSQGGGKGPLASRVAPQQKQRQLEEGGEGGSSSSSSSARQGSGRLPQTRVNALFTARGAAV